MPRTSRARSDSGYYHVMLKRAGRQYLFDDDVDRLTFLRILQTACQEFGIAVIAWCLMDNHIHLVLLDEDDHLSDAVRRIALRYAQHYNRRSGHVGHVFQNRFRSKPIETDEYLLESVRYVHNNPAKIGIPARDYPWNSYAEYVSGRAGIASTAAILDMIGGSEHFDEFLLEGSAGASFPTISRASTDDEVRGVAKSILGFEGAELGSLPKARRDELLRKLGDAGLSIRQIERLTGIGRNTVARALHEAARG